MDEDAQALVDLLKMQERIRKQAEEQVHSADGARTLPVQPPSPLAGPHTTQGHSGQHSPLSSHVDVNKRSCAIAYLESIPLSFLYQVSTSLTWIQSQTAAPRKKVVKGRKMVDQETQHGAGESDGEGVGITLRLKNRQTGQDQFTFFPDNPLSSDAREPALHRMGAFAAAKLIACIMRVASLLLEAIVTETTTTKRYSTQTQLTRGHLLQGRSPLQDPTRRRQGLLPWAALTKLVDDIVASAGLKRQDFYVTATSKGLIASSALEVTMKSGKLSLSSINASLIPPIERIAHISGRVEWVLIVEKDAVFQTLCSSGLLDDDRLGPGALITGKGYPDLATLQLVHRIAYDFPSAAICVLVDADPHGLDILSVYTNGSKATTHSHDYADLALGERMHWIGVTTEDWQRCGVEYDRLLLLSDKDVQKATAMLRNTALPASWRRELSRMLHLNRKAEIQIISSIADEGSDARRKNALVEYVVERIGAVLS